jgi:hypothetical protein
VVDEALSVSSDISDELEIGESHKEDGGEKGEQNGGQPSSMYLKEEEESELDSSYNGDGLRSR